MPPVTSGQRVRVRRPGPPADDADVVIDVRVLDQRDPCIAESICEVQRAVCAVEAVLTGDDGVEVVRFVR